MKILHIACLLGLAATFCRADDVPELKAIEAKYDSSQFAGNEALREKYITELAVLRFKLSKADNPGWQVVDAEIIKHPAPENLDAKAFKKEMAGTWHSPRHDYLFKANGTWIMDYDPSDPDSTHGTWSIKGNQYTETVEDPMTYTLILIDKENFIFTDGKVVFYEKKSLKGGLPLRRDE